MPIYEFKCTKCSEFFEIFVTNTEEKVEMRCPKCHSEEFERVLSASSYAMGGGRSKASAVTRNCSEGSCTTYTLPGPT